MSSSSTSVQYMVDTLRARRARVPSEVGAYLVLEACEKLQRRPSILSADQISVGDGGEVSVSGTVAPCEEPTAAAALCRLLSFLLVASEDNISPGLLEILEVDPSSWTLARLRDALEANLVPLNRQASRRVLSRLVRESQRPGPLKEPYENVTIPLANVPHIEDSNGTDSLDAFLNEDRETKAFDGDPDLDLPDLDPPQLDAPQPEMIDLDPPDLGPPQPLHFEPPTRTQDSIFSDRQSHFESLDEAEGAQGMWLWVGVGALLVAALVIASALV